MNQPKILVAIRKRPLSKKEQSKGETDIIACKNPQTLIVSQYKQKVDLTKYIEESIFNFDFAFNEHTTNEQIYVNGIRPLVDSAFLGAKVTCFAYGQTGSGKTFTMNGSAKMGVVGLYQYGAHDIFAYLSDPRFQHLKAKLSFFEIYCGKLFDLLNKRQQLKIRQDNKQNINIIGIQEREIRDYKEFKELLNVGSNSRITSQNSANSESSRSHAILQIILKEGKKVFGKISFIDLAGNQRGADHTDMKKQTRIDGAEINKSLLSLKECIRALDQGKGHTPFRGSKLTMVLKDSFVGFCRTFMIGNVSPSSASSQNTLNTLRYADRVKQLRKPTEGISKQELKARQMMLPRQNKNAIKIDINNDDDAEDIEMKRKEAQKNYGLKQQPQQTQEYEEQVTRKQSFTNPNRPKILSNNMKNSQSIQAPNLNSSKNLNASKHLKQPIASNNVAKVNMANQKKVPILSNSIQIRKSNEMQDESPTLHARRQNNFIENRSINVRNGGGQGFNGNYNHTGNNFSNSNSLHNNNTFNQYKTNFETMPNISQPNYNNIHNYSKQPQHSQHQPSYQNYQGQNYHGVQGYHNNQNGGFRQNYGRQSVQPKLLQDWNGMVDFMQTCTDGNLRSQIQQKLHEKLFNQENALISSHSDTLRSSLDIIKSQMNLINTLQNNRDTIGTRKYMSLLQQSIDEKISLLEMLKQRMVQFSYKLDTVEQIEGTMQNEDKMNDEDLLLDDLH